MGVNWGMTQTEKDAVLGARIRQYLEAESTISLLESEINKATGYVRDFRERIQKPQISTSRPADEVAARRLGVGR